MNKEKTITVSIPQGKRAEWVNGVLTLVDELPVDITERVKTLEDAVEILGHGNPLVDEYNYLFKMKGRSATKDIEAYLALRIITAALNEGWSPTFAKGEIRHYPYFQIYTKEEVSKMAEKEKEELGLFFGYAYFGLDCGLVAADSSGVWSTSGSGFGSRLAYKTRDLAIYSVKQFPELWYQFLIGDNQK